MDMASSISYRVGFLLCVLVTLGSASLAQTVSPATNRVSRGNPRIEGVFRVAPGPQDIVSVCAAMCVDRSRLVVVFGDRMGTYVRVVDISGAVQPHDEPPVALFRDTAIPAVRAEIGGSIFQGDATVTFYEGEQVVARYQYLRPESKNPWIRVGPSTHHMVVGEEVFELTRGLTSGESDFRPGFASDAQLPALPSRVTVATAGRWVLQLCQEQPSIVVYNSDDGGHSATIPAKLVPFEKMYQALRTDQKDTGLDMHRTWMQEQIRDYVPANPAGVERVLSELVELSGDAKLAATLRRRPVFPTTVPTVWGGPPKDHKPGWGPPGPRQQ